MATDTQKAPWIGDPRSSRELGSPVVPRPQPADSPDARNLHPGADPKLTLRLAIQGFDPSERYLIDGLVRISQRRSPHFELAPATDAGARAADVILIDGKHPDTKQWASERPWLSGKAVIWVDASKAHPSHVALNRPVPWMSLPMMLLRAIETHATAHEHQAPASGAAHPVTVAPAKQHRGTVLVVDDSLAVRTFLRAILEQTSFRVIEADSVAVAMRQLSDESVEYVLMDVQMPDVDGYEGCRLIKASLRSGRALPVVMLTAKSSPFDKIRGRMAGCDAYLVKPVNSVELCATLVRLHSSTNG